jgi:hypothetical protein
MYKLLPAQDDESLFYRLDGEAAERHGAIGYMRADFGTDGWGFYFKWFDSQPHLKTRDFRRELDNIVNTLRVDGQETPFANRKVMERYCAAYPGQDLFLRGDGYVIRTDDFSYYIRCRPASGDYDIYMFAYDNRYLLPELAGQHELPELCYSTLPSSGALIQIVRGENGYFECANAHIGKEANRMFADTSDRLNGVTRAQEEAMLAGSMFGWDVPGAKPWKYDQDGNLRTHQPKKTEPER